MTVTQSLKSLRLEHARLLEEHGSTTATLRTREGELLALDRRLADAQQNIQSLELEVRAAKEHATRKEQQTTLAEREVGFLQALVASYTAEEAALDDPRIDEAKMQRLQELEALLGDYKAENQKLQKQVIDLSTEKLSYGEWTSRTKLAELLEAEKAANVEAQQRKPLP